MDFNQLTNRRGNRRVTPSRRDKESNGPIVRRMFNIVGSNILNKSRSYLQKLLFYSEWLSTFQDCTINEYPNYSIYANHGKIDVFMFHEMIREHDASEFLKSMEKEITDHTKRNHWTLVKTDQVLKNENVIQAI